MPQGIYLDDSTVSIFRDMREAAWQHERALHANDHWLLLACVLLMLAGYKFCRGEQ